MDRNLMVVAHPDDESLFGGAALLNGEQWEVICVTNSKNVVRAREFTEAMHQANASFQIWDYPDNDNFWKTLPTLTNDLAKILKTSYQKVVTHNIMGEYGHGHHVCLHKIMLGLKSPFYCFAQGKPLPEEIWQKKLALISVYHSQRSVCQHHLPMARQETLKKHWTIKHI
jgi:hypothetical protein